MIEDHPGAIALSFDVGGTFTDFVAIDTATGAVAARHKVLTNARYPARGVVRGWQEMASAGLDATSVHFAVHSTTLVTNALIERKGATTALVTTRGFRDILELGREQLYDIYDLFAPPPDPLIPRPLRMEVVERIDAAGTVLQAPDPASIAAVIDELRVTGVAS
ncbi:MAG TPA: methylhydantoinase, partial [Chloroflexi bacterium]|nr:methylhydantoinase [Chloroflexota bacterium]